MSYKGALKFLSSLNAFGSVPGLERITRLLKELGDPQDKLKFIHVAGTNGKGSVCQMVASCLKSGGFKAGLFISPFVIDFRERIQINGKFISKRDFSKNAKKVKNALSKIRDDGFFITEFEFITAVAFEYFRNMKCDVVVLETGLGGRFDATNVIKKNLVSAITSISIDHTAVLGDTVEKIAFEKAGIIKNDSSVVLSYGQLKSVDEVIRNIAKEKNTALFIPDFTKINDIKSDIYGTEFLYGDEKYKLSLLGEHQVINAVTAIEIVNRCGLSVSIEAINTGLQKASNPARLEVISKKPLVLIDGAHNKEGAESLKKFLNKKRATVILGMMKDKDCDGVLESVAEFAEKIITVTVKGNSRSMQAPKLAEMARRYCENVEFADSYSGALKSVEKKENLVVCGSLYLAGDIRKKVIKKYK